jgi:predicted nucleic acid-binding Zn ribbon protein
MTNRDKNITPLKEAIEKLLKVYKIEDKMDEISLQKEWNTMMGPAIANRTKKIYLKNKVLHIQLESSVLRHELSFAKEKLCETLNKRAGKRIINQILFF